MKKHCIRKNNMINRLENLEEKISMNFSEIYSWLYHFIVFKFKLNLFNSKKFEHRKHSPRVFQDDHILGDTNNNSTVTSAQKKTVNKPPEKTTHTKTSPNSKRSAHTNPT